MKIALQSVLPDPLAGTEGLESQVWQKHLSLEPGKKYKISAASGKGKSTFIHILYGLRADFSGDVNLEGKNIKTISRKEWAEYRQKKISIVFQDLRLFLHLKAIDNIKIKSVLYPEFVPEKIGLLAQALHADHLLEKEVQKLSYGERQRIAILRALVQPFDWLFLDEPFSHLDRNNSIAAAQLISEEVDQRKAGMIITSLGHNDFFHNTETLEI